MLRSNPQRLAWATMLSGLVVFLLLCTGSVIFARWLIFESPTSLNATLHVGKGTVGLAEPDASDEKAIRSSASVERNSTLTTDNLSQGYIEFTDPYSNRVVATIMLHNDSVAVLRSASRPRFNLSDNPYSIRLSGVIGRVEVWIGSDLDREIRIEIDAPMGTTYIGEKGNFLIESTPSLLNVATRDGSATLVSQDGSVQHLATSTQGEITQDNSGIRVDATALDLLPNSTFGQNQVWPEEWVCAHAPDPGFPNAPGGIFEFLTIDGRSTIHIERLHPNPGPAKTGCIQVFGGEDSPQGLDVTPYETLQIRVTMRVQHQSLSACGIAGSECPVMLKITYLDQNGNHRIWYHGFYAEYSPDAGGRRTCDSCLEPHEQINKGAWYTYESGNLFTDWPEDLRPGSIKEVEFYSSGHEYEAFLSEVSLVATLPEDDQSGDTPS